MRTLFNVARDQPIIKNIKDDLQDKNIELFKDKTSVTITAQNDNENKSFGEAAYTSCYAHDLGSDHQK